MNKEIIRKIAQQATQTCISIADSKAWVYEDEVVRIVLKECVDIITKEYLSMNVGSDWEDGKLCGLIAASNLLLEHFILQDHHE